jgi:RNA polymerase sigma factor (sigma-70 family)
MMTKSDLELLQEFALEASEQAFAALVRRYSRLVYSSALRQTGASGLAEEITQAVFLLLAKKAKSLNSKVMLGGWLLRTTRYIASRARLSEQRRILREKEATQMRDLENTDETWTKLAPLLDEGMDRLSEQDQNLLLLHYIEGFDLSGVCAKMGLNKETAKKRQLRALEKLRKFFARHGFTITTTGIGTFLSARMTEAVPLTLEGAITEALAKGAPSSAVATLLQETSRLVWSSNFKIGLVGIAIAFLLAVSSRMGGAKWISDSLSKRPPVKINETSVTLVPRQIPTRFVTSEPAIVATMQMRVIDATTAMPISNVSIRTLEIQ